MTYPLRNGEFVNIVAVEESSKNAETGWDHAQSRDDFLNIFGAAFPYAKELLTQANDIKQWAILADDTAMLQDVFGSPIIGDAALTMPPFMAQGAAMAIEDAALIASDIASGLKTWSPASLEKRKQRKQAVMRAAIRNGQLFHFYPPIIGPLYHFGMSVAGHISPGLLARRYQWIYDYRHSF